MEIFTKKWMASLLLIPCIFTLVACGGTTVKDISVDKSIAKVGGLTTVTAEVGEGKMQITAEGGFSEARVATYGALGEQNFLTIEYKGEISKADAKEHSTGMIETATRARLTEKNETPGYYTDFVNIDIKVPVGTTKIRVIDGFGSNFMVLNGTDPLTTLKDDVLTHKTQWLLSIGSGDAMTWQPCGGFNTVKKQFDGLMYYEFQNAEDAVLGSYIAYFIYDLTFVA